MRSNRPAWGNFALRTRALLGMALLVLIGVLGLHYARVQAPAVTRADEPALVFAGHLEQGRSLGRPSINSLGKLPLAFEVNQGQADSEVKYMARGSGYGLFLTSQEAVLALTARSSRISSTKSSVLRMKLAGAENAAKVTAADELPGKSNYLIGNDPSKWHRGIRQYARVRYAGVYPGVDLVYYGNQGSLEYDFEVAPGADPRAVQLTFQGMEKIWLDDDDNLILETTGGDVQLQAPTVYQMIGSERRSVSGKFALLADNRIGFELGDYDRSHALIIDPVLSYSSYFGGTGAEDFVRIAVDSGFNIYLAGETTSTVPVINPPAPFQTTPNPPSDVFVVKLDPTGSTLLFSTLLGGTGTDFPAGIAVDAGSDVFVAGTTSAGDFPTAGTNAAFQTTPKGPGNHAFVTELKPDGSGLTYSTYLSGTGNDVAAGLAIDNRSNAYVIGTTTSTDFPVTSGTFQSTLQSNIAFFVSKITPNLSAGSSLPFSTYFGGGTPAKGAIASGGGIAVDPTGLIYITGGTNLAHLGNTGTSATDFPILNAAQPCLNVPAVAPTTPPTPPSPCAAPTAVQDAFVAKLNPAAGTGAQVVYSTYLGGSGDDVGNGIAVDSGGNVFVTGSTTSADEFKPTGTTPLQPNNAGGGDAFVAKLNNPAASAAVAITYFSYLGGTGADSGSAIVVDNAQIASLTGSTASANFPATTATAPQAGFGGGLHDAFIARIDTTASTTTSLNNLVSFLGGTGDDHGTGIALDTSFQAYVAGDTSSGNFPVRGTAFQGGLQGGSDAFITKLGGISDLQVTVAPTVNPIGVGNQDTFKYTITNNGPDPTSGVNFTATLPSSGATAGTTSSSPGSCATAVSNSVQCLIGTLGKGATATVTVLLTPTTSAQSLTTSGTVGVTPSINPPSIDTNAANNSASASVPVTDFSISASPSTNTVAAGNTATYQVTVAPLPTYTNSISLSCSAGLPATGPTRCDFSTTPVTISNSSPVSSTLTISTTARPVPTTSLRRTGEILFAAFLPLGGFTLLGAGFAGLSPRKKRIVLGVLLIALLSLIGMQVACGGGSSKPATTGGTAAGTYTVTITGTSGSASHGTAVTLVVQ